MSKAMKAQTTPIFSYPIASADMRYIEIGTREIYLYTDPEAGLVFRGEITGCGTDCYEDLSEVLLEYALSCEGCKDESEAACQAAQLGEMLGDALIERIRQDNSDLEPSAHLKFAMKCVLNSLGAQFVQKVEPDQISFSLACCPISECAARSGLNRSVERAYLSFTALCKRLIQGLAPEWVLLEPSEKHYRTPVRAVVLARGQQA